MKKILQWYSADNKENYKPIIIGEPNYTQDEITYEFTPDDYRCDEFSDFTSEFPLLFMGCSISEGVGLPINEIWSYHLHKKIVTLTNKSIPYWSIAKSGTSIDYSARCFYDYNVHLKSKYAFYLMSGISRREYQFENAEMKHWCPLTSPDKDVDLHEKLLSQIFSDQNFTSHQTLRSAMILNATAHMTGTKIFIFGLSMDTFGQVQKINLFNKFNCIEYIPVSMQAIETASKFIEIPDYIKNRPTKARDSLHPSAVWQYKLYNFIWENVKDKLIL